MKQEKLFLESKKFYLEDDDPYPKFVVEIKGNSAKNIIISIIQDWIRRKSTDLEIQTIGLQIFKLESSKVFFMGLCLKH